jgi:comEA protein
MVVGIGFKLEESMGKKEVLREIKAEPTVILGKININTANLRQLIDLPGIGEKIAQRIIDYRLSNGLFKNKEAIKNVSGIGEKTYEALKNKIDI